MKLTFTADPPCTNLIDKERGMKEPEDKSPAYVLVKDCSGKEYICPRDALRDPREFAEEELKKCLDSRGEPFSDEEVLAIIKSEFRKVES